MNNNHCVYMHRNIQNGKVYIGQTNNPSRRWNYNGYYYKTCPRFWSAIQKYGWNGFEHIILEENLTQEEADDKEQYYILLYDSTNLDKGYNLTFGGFGLGNYYAEEKNRLIQSKRRKRYIQEHPEEKQEMIARMHTVEAVKKAAETKKEKYKNGQSPLNEINEKRKKYVKCVETGKIFSSLCEAADFYNISVYNLSTHLNHPDKRKSCGKFNGLKMHWVFAEESMS